MHQNYICPSQQIQRLPTTSTLFKMIKTRKENYKGNGECHQNHLSEDLPTTSQNRILPYGIKVKRMQNQWVS